MLGSDVVYQKRLCLEYISAHLLKWVRAILGPLLVNIWYLAVLAGLPNESGKPDLNTNCPPNQSCFEVKLYLNVASEMVCAVLDQLGQGWEGSLAHLPKQTSVE